MAHDVGRGEGDMGDAFHAVRESRIASASPEVAPGGRSTWEGSPFTTMRLPSPSLVRNIFICCGVVFWASSRMTKALRERAAAHERQRRDFDGSVGHAARDELGRRDVVERVIERAEIGIDLLLHVAGKEAEPFARLDGRARQDDAIDLAGGQRRRGGGDRQIGLAGSGRDPSR